MKWEDMMDKFLYGYKAPRLMSTMALYKIAQEAKLTITRKTFHLMVKDMKSAGKLVQVRKGLYANLRALPQVVPAEAAQYLFPGAVVSLQYVLGAFGVINNPPRAVTVVAPIQDIDGKRIPPSVRTLTGEFSEYRVHALPAWLFTGKAGSLEDREDGSVRYYRRATPEKALVDWIYLAGSPHSRLPMPPFDTDIEDLDMDRLLRLGKNAGIEERLRGFIDGLGRGGEDEEPGRFLELQGPTRNVSR
jgi:hypothetical protein